MRIDVRNLLASEAGTVDRLARTAVELEVLDARMRDVVVGGTITKTDEGLLVDGTVTAELTLTCSRCLRPFPYQAEITFSERYVREPGDEQWPHDARAIDLAPMLGETLLVAAPVRPLHEPDCQGLCPVCGKDLNDEPHTHPPPPADNPFAKLRDLS